MSKRTKIVELNDKPDSSDAHKKKMEKIEPLICGYVVMKSYYQPNQLLKIV